MSLLAKASKLDLKYYFIDHACNGIRYVGPAERHVGEDVAILAARHALYRRPRPGIRVAGTDRLATGRR